MLDFSIFGDFTALSFNAYLKRMRGNSFRLKQKKLVSSLKPYLTNVGEFVIRDLEQCRVVFSRRRADLRDSGTYNLPRIGNHVSHKNYCDKFVTQFQTDKSKELLPEYVNECLSKLQISLQGLVNILIDVSCNDGYISWNKINDHLNDVVNILYGIFINIDRNNEILTRFMMLDVNYKLLEEKDHFL